MALEAPCSSSSSSSFRSNVYYEHHDVSDEKGLTETELSAAQQLMQLSDEDNNDSSERSGGSNKREMKEEGVEYQSPLSVITWAKIEEIFGKEDAYDQDYRPKKRRFRSVSDIYLTTKPVRT